MSRLHALLPLAALVFLPALPTQALDAAAWCPPEEVAVEPDRHLRNLSLDLRGVVPTLDDYGVVEDAGEVPDWLLDEWLGSEEFVERVVRHHRDLLWPNVSNVGLFNASTALIYDGHPALWRRSVATTYRGQSVPCLDEPADFDGDVPVAYEQPDGTFREGWVEEILPYWDESTPVKVCAFDAQDRAVGSTGASCADRETNVDPLCGCGPELRWCRRGNATQLAVNSSFGEDLERRVAEVVRSDASYLDLFTDRRMWVNGPAVHFWREMVGLSAGVRLTPAPLDTTQLPDLDYLDDETWLPVQLGEHHAGILTSPAFLLRFQTQRARANQFYSRFLCQPFQPPEGGLPAADGDVELDLQVRSGCAYCHALLEPAAAYWGRWTPSGAGWLDPAVFPPERADCAQCAHTATDCSPECNRYYVTSALTAAQEPYLGMLDAYEFRRPDHYDHVELGPKQLLAQGVADGRFTDCTVRTTARWLLGREPLPEEEAWIDDLDRDFVAGDYRYTDLVRAIVTSPVYGRVQ